MKVWNAIGGSYKTPADEVYQGLFDWPARENPNLETLGFQSTTDRNLVDVVNLFGDKYQEQDATYPSGSEEHQVPWTRVTTNQKFIGHLFHLYFTWVHPVHMLFSESDFKNDFTSNRGNYCSASLVNAICAMSCNLLGNQQCQNQFNILDAATLRDRFMDEARRYLLPESYYLMTSIQTFAVMFLVELSSGRARNAVGYLRSAIDNRKCRDSTQHSKEAKEITLWGIQTLNSYDNDPPWTLGKLNFD